MTRTGRLNINGRIAIFFWEGYLGVAPSLINGIRLLAAAGYQVRVITRSTPEKYAESPNFPVSVDILVCHPVSGRIKRLLHGKRFLWRFDEFFEKGLYELMDHIQFALFGLWRILRHKYVCFIGVDMSGIVIGKLLGRVKKVPVIYWSLEIRFLSEFKDSFLRRMKCLEKQCSRGSIFIIIQDLWRADALASENKLDTSKIMIVPNGPCGPPITARSDFLQRRFQISPSELLILHLGMICPEVFSFELAEVAGSWREGTKLIFHDREKRDRTDPYLRDIEEVGQGRVLLSLDPVPYDDLDTIVSSAHIGVVLYQTQKGPNFGLMAGASGKLGHYLRCGLPVIVLDLPGLGELITKYQCGIPVKNLAETEQAIRKIEGQYETYRANAFRCYTEVYEFGAHFRQALEKIDALGGEI